MPYNTYLKGQTGFTMRFPVLFLMILATVAGGFAEAALKHSSNGANPTGIPHGAVTGSEPPAD